MTAGSKWTPAEDAILRKLWGAGVPSRQIAEELGNGRTHGAVRERKSILELPPRDTGAPIRTDRGPVWSDEEMDAWKRALPAQNENFLEALSQTHDLAEIKDMPQTHNGAIQSIERRRLREAAEIMAARKREAAERAQEQATRAAERERIRLEREAERQRCVAAYAERQREAETAPEQARAVLAAVAKDHGVTVEQMLRKDKWTAQTVVAAKAAAIELYTQFPNKPMRWHGEQLNRHHEWVARYLREIGLRSPTIPGRADAFAKLRAEDRPIGNRRVKEPELPASAPIPELAAPEPPPRVGDGQVVGTSPPDAGPGISGTSLFQRAISFFRALR
jgi:hypothetical protein